MLSEPLSILRVWEGGMSSHGGILGVVLFSLYYARRHKLTWTNLGDNLVVAVPIGLFLGRCANFINGELYGRPTNVAWAMVFPEGGPMPRHPSQLYEAILEGLVLFVILRWLYKKNFYPGTVFWTLVAFYGLFRFLVEFVREPDAQIGFALGPFTRGQELTLPMLVVGTVMMIIYMRRPVPEPAHPGR
jgi:phosphatidylglycerol:prolipoprotein diacylglycerol transferase